MKFETEIVAELFSDSGNMRRAFELVPGKSHGSGFENGPGQMLTPVVWQLPESEIIYDSFWVNYKGRGTLIMEMLKGHSDLCSN